MLFRSAAERLRVRLRSRGAAGRPVRFNSDGESVGERGSAWPWRSENGGRERRGRACLAERPVRALCVRSRAEGTLVGQMVSRLVAGVRCKSTRAAGGALRSMVGALGCASAYSYCGALALHSMAACGRSVPFALRSASCALRPDRFVRVLGASRARVAIGGVDARGARALGVVARRAWPASAQRDGVDALFAAAGVERLCSIAGLRRRAIDACVQRAWVVRPMNTTTLRTHVLQPTSGSVRGVVRLLSC